MSYLPAWKDDAKNGLECFIRDHQPNSLKEAKLWRQNLIAALNHASVPLNRWSEHPDSLYLEENADVDPYSVKT